MDALKHQECLSSLWAIVGSRSYSKFQSGKAQTHSLEFEWHQGQCFRTRWDINGQTVRRSSVNQDLVKQGRIGCIRVCVQWLARETTNVHDVLSLWSVVILAATLLQYQIKLAGYLESCDSKQL